MNELVSNCCGARPWMGMVEYERCGECKENCEFEEIK